MEETYINQESLGQAGEPNELKSVGIVESQPA